MLCRVGTEEALSGQGFMGGPEHPSRRSSQGQLTACARHCGLKTHQNERKGMLKVNTSVWYNCWRGCTKV